MQALGQGEGTEKAISWTSFKEACEQMEDLDAMLTLVWPEVEVSSAEPAAAAAAAPVETAAAVSAPG
jgi:hypothetical protein